MKKDKVVFFDLFDTLVKVDRGYLEPYFDRETDRLGDLGVLKNAEQTIDRLIEINEHNSPNLLDTKSISEMARYYEERMRDSLMNPPAGVLDMLKDLKESGVQLCVISDAAYVDIMSWDDSPLAQYFDKTCFSCEVGLVKPDPELFKHAQAMFGYPDKCIFIGDGGHEELMGARRCAMQTIKAEWIKNRREEAIYEYADRKLQMTSQVPAAVQEMNRGLKQMLAEKQMKIDYAATCFKESITPVLCDQSTLDYYFGSDIEHGDVEGLSVPAAMFGVDDLNNHFTLTNMIETDLGVILLAEDANGNKYSLSSIDITSELADIEAFDSHQLESFGFVIEDGEIVPTIGNDK